MRVSAAAISLLLAVTGGEAFVPTIHSSRVHQTKYTPLFATGLPSEAEPALSALQEKLLSGSSSNAADALFTSLLSPESTAKYNDVSSLLSDLIAATPAWQFAVISALGLASLFQAWVNTPIDYSETPYPPGTNTYDPKKSQEFYSKRPGMVIKRVLQLGLLSGAFNTGILFDWLVLGKLLKDEEYTALKKAEPRRAKESLALCEKLVCVVLNLRVEESLECLPVCFLTLYFFRNIRDPPLSSWAKP